MRVILRFHMLFDDFTIKKAMEKHIKDLYTHKAICITLNGAIYMWSECRQNNHAIMCACDSVMLK